MALWAVRLILGALAVGLLAAAPAAADVSAKGLRYVSVTDSVEDNSQEGTQAICPNNEPVISGGVFADAGYEPRVEINTTRPYDDDGDERLDDGWIAYVQNLNGGNPPSASYTVFAICDKKAKESDYRYKASATVPAPEGSQVGVPMNCPNDEPGVGGGVSSSGFLNDEMALNTARPFDDGDSGKRMDDGWSVYVDNNNVGSAGQFVVGFVICDRAHSPKSYAYSDQSTSIDDMTQEVIPAQCGGDTSLVGGGLRSSGDYTQRMYAVANYFSDNGGTTQPETWQAGVNNVTGGGSFQSLTSYAVCRK
jgi:hypothetical protein